ncbi:hypothetical protein CVT25_005908 [Psilocybe cyanescens]|uniref:MYND-type domain-containing protein n=1 Tax=Psilocybe cyanescens TaxID=93625 RepID=A0A409VM23_PSICY|nr:hypothetical protein CVT25_005908 [Psilocybe cyanescens]
MDANSKPENSSPWKGQSRVLKVCHWCAKKQEPDQKPFQASARCKESKECQVASWPLHKGPCKLSADAKIATAGNPVAAMAIANFKKCNPDASRLDRHSLHLGALHHAAICALDLGHNPAALDDHRRYEPVSGFTPTMKETREMIGWLFHLRIYTTSYFVLVGKMRGASILDSFK